MVDLVQYWAVSFKTLHPQVKVNFHQGGSATAPPALVDGSGNIGLMSRKMKDDEVKAFVTRFGYQPTEIRVAIDALAVYVRNDNPIEGLTLAQVDAIFSATRQCGHSEDIRTWGRLGLTGAWQNRPIKLHSRDAKSGTNAFFSEHALCKGKFKTSAKIHDTSHEIVYAVKLAPDAIGYAGIGLLKDGGVRAVPLATKAGQPYIVASAENAYSGTYPLTRFLYIYINKTPGQPAPKLVHEFFKMVLSTDGQSKVAKAGFLPLSPEMVRGELAKLN